MTDYFALLIQLNGLNLSSAAALEKLTESADGAADILSAARLTDENKITALNRLNRLAQYLKKEFLPPLDREDILALAHKLLRVNFCMADIACRLKPREPLVARCFAEIAKTITLINEVLPQLKRIKKCAALPLIQECRNQAALIKKDGIPSCFYEDFSRLLDNLLSICDTIEVILVKYS